MRLGALEYDVQVVNNVGVQDDLEAHKCIPLLPPIYEYKGSHEKIPPEVGTQG
jgi:hypothetical protein